MDAEDLFDEPADVQNFLHRYHEARVAARSPPTTPKQTKPTPPSPPSASGDSPASHAKNAPQSPSTRTDAARAIWGSVFHPLGKSPTTADRYDLSRGQTSAPGMSASEVHAKGTGISLDAKNDE